MSVNNRKYHYVYRITNTNEDRHYIGVRSCDCHPQDDIGIKYFGSSNKAFILHQKRNKKEYIYHVIQFFETRDLANRHERYLHGLYDVGNNVTFFNGRNQSSEKWCTLGKRKINDGLSEFFVEQQDVYKYLELGYKLGRIKREYIILRNTYINDGNFEYHIKPEEISKYLEEGYTLGRLPMTDITKFKLHLAHTGKTLTNEHKSTISSSTLGSKKSDQMKQKLSDTRTGMIYINNGNIEKIINPFDQCEYIIDGWMLGKLPMPESHKESISKSSIGKPGTTTGKIRINNGKVEKFILIEELESFIQQGWIKGNKLERKQADYSNRTGTTTGRIGINNGVNNKFIMEDELESYIQQGWYRGSKSNKK